MSRKTPRSTTPARRRRRLWTIATAVALFGGAIGLSVAAAGWADGTHSDGAKKAELARQLDAANDAQRAKAPKDVKPADPRAAGPAVAAGGGAVAWDEGVFDTQEAPIPHGIITITSMWGQTVGDYHYAVYAGASASDPSQGLVIVQTYAVTGAHLTDEDYPAPAGTGPLRVVSANGHRLSLTSGSGAALVFDVDTRRFG